MYNQYSNNTKEDTKNLHNESNLNSFVKEKEIIPKNNTYKMHSIVNKSVQKDEFLSLIDVESPKVSYELSHKEKVKRRLSVDEWNSFKDDEGRIKNVDEVKRTIFFGSVDSSLRKELWKYQLGLYDWSKTKEENEKNRNLKLNEYFRMKYQWQMFTKDQLGRFKELSLRMNLVEVDVVRTDRKRPFYNESDGWGLRKLQEILYTYCMYDFDLGYVQGMNDLLAVILEVMQNESDAFWCFIGYMKLVRGNFVMNLEGLREQLENIQVLVKFYDPELWSHLKKEESSDMMFCFQWISIRFKREFDFESIQRLWEVFWTEYPCKNFHLVFCLALLKSKRSELLQQNCDYSEILKHTNNMAGNINLEESLKTAYDIYMEFAKKSEHLPHNVKNILDF